MATIAQKNWLRDRSEILEIATIAAIAAIMWQPGFISCLITVSVLIINVNINIAYIQLRSAIWFQETQRVERLTSDQQVNCMFDSCRWLRNVFWVHGRPKTVCKDEQITYILVQNNDDTGKTPASYLCDLSRCDDWWITEQESLVVALFKASFRSPTDMHTFFNGFGSDSLPVSHHEV